MPETGLGLITTDTLTASKPLESTTQETVTSQSTSQSAVDQPVQVLKDLAESQKPSNTEADDRTMSISGQFRPKHFQFPKTKFGRHFRSCRSQWFDDYPWLHYDEGKDSVFCFVCAQKNSNNNLFSARNKESAFITEGFLNWKEAVEKFQEHQTSKCHLTAMDCDFRAPRRSGDDWKCQVLWQKSPCT